MNAPSSISSPTKTNKSSKSSDKKIKKSLITASATGGSSSVNLNNNVPMSTLSSSVYVLPTTNLAHASDYNKSSKNVDSNLNINHRNMMMHSGQE